MDYWHESPTFLNRRNELALGLSPAQLLFVMATLAIWGFICLMLGAWITIALIQWGLALLGAGATVALALVKLGGLRLYHYVALFVWRQLRRPIYLGDLATLLTEPTDAGGSRWKTGAAQGWRSLRGSAALRQGMWQTEGHVGNFYRGLTRAVRETARFFWKGPARSG